MKRQLNLSFVILLAITMLLSACGAETETSTTAINIPAVSIGQATESNETYPVGGAEQTYPAGSVATEAPNTYPAEGTGQMSETEIEELLKEKLDGHHTLEWVLSFDKTYEEWEELLSDHHGVTFTSEEKDQVIQYLMTH
jgi:hypothetical protein